jgi:hypothetical protein
VSWDPAFPLYGVVRVAGGLLWLFVNLHRSVNVPSERTVAKHVGGK